MTSHNYQQAVAIFTARETPEEVQTTLAKVVAAADQSTLVDILVNGNRPLLHGLESAAPAIAAHLPAGVGLRIWWIALGNKAHAWNQYVSTIWPQTEHTCFLDGYVSVRTGLPGLLRQTMQQWPQTIAVSGYPVSGRSSARIQAEIDKHGGLHGNLFAINRPTLEALRSRDIRLPLGLYGFDTVLGGILGYGLDPQRNAWDLRRRVASTPDIYWHVREKQWWNIIDVRTQLKRIMNNALRSLVRKATIDYLSVRKIAPEQLPRSIEDYVLTWARSHPEQLRRTVLSSPLSAIHYRRLQRPRDWHLALTPPECRFETAPDNPA